MDTETLIQRLADDGTPVRRLAAPATRALVWLGIALPFIAATAVWHGFDRDVAALLKEPRFLAEQCAALATAIAAAMAAFAVSTPGMPRLYRLAPLPPLGLWLFTLGAACADGIAESGAAWFGLGIDFGCLPAMAIAGIVPAAAMLLMLRRALPLAPRLTLFYAALAPAATVAFALQFFHHADVTPTALVWHFGLAWLAAPLLALFGRTVIRWPGAARS